MKNKIYFLVCGCLTLVLSLRTSAQRIYFSDTTNEWLMGQAGEMVDGFSTATWHEMYASDSLIEDNGYYYTEIKQWERTLMRVRDDTMAGLVYARLLDNNSPYRVTDTNEFVYLNYNLQIGDTLVMPLVFSWNHTDSVSIHVVKGMDSFTINNNWYKEFEFDAYKGMGNEEQPSRYKVYEGIGPKSGPIILPFPLGEYGPPNLFCFRNRGVIPEMFGLNCFAPVPIKEPEKKVKHFHCYPNPAFDKLTIREGTSAKNCYVKISDLRGNLLLETKFKHETVLDVERFAAGIYILQFIADANVLQFDKLVIQK